MRDRLGFAAMLTIFGALCVGGGVDMFTVRVGFALTVAGLLWLTFEMAVAGDPRG